MDSIPSILAFVRAAEAGSFAQAGKALGITASGIGKSISRLEARLGVRLMRRTTRSLSLTDDGALFFERCRKALEELEAAENAISDRSLAPRGRLRASVPSTLGKRFIVPRLPAFLSRYPDLTLELSLSDRRVNLVEDAIDIAVRIGALDDSSLMTRALGQQQVITISAPSYLASYPVTAIADLTRRRCIVFRLPSTGCERPWHFVHERQVLDFRPRSQLTLDDGEAMVEAVRAGLGITQVPSYMAASALKEGSAVEVLAGMRPKPDPITGLYASQQASRLGLRVFLDFLSTVPELQCTRFGRAQAAPSNSH